VKVVFLDRDGTLIAEPGDHQVDSLEKLEFSPGIIQGLRLLQGRGYGFVMVSNQDNLGTQYYSMTAYMLVQRKLMKLLSGEGIRFLDVFICPHGPENDCRCRKPKTGLVDEFLKTNIINLTASYMIGDRESDVEFGKNLGVRTIRLAASDTAPTGANHAAQSFLDACTYIVDRERFTTLRRKTNETEIRIELSLDGTGSHDIATGIGFFDHMLEQIVKHSSMDAVIRVAGDVHVDEHHTVEDTGIALGETIRQALGDKRGIDRYGFVLPMDEAQAQVALDLGGRSFLAFTAEFERDRVGELPTELVEDFFRAFADGLRANLHISVTGRNDHHKIEACFKGVARALRQAIRRETGLLDVLPTTKGIL